MNPQPTPTDAELDRALGACLIRCAACGLTAGDDPAAHLEELADAIASELAYPADDDGATAWQIRVTVLAVLRERAVQS